MPNHTTPVYCVRQRCKHPDTNRKCAHTNDQHTHSLFLSLSHTHRPDAHMLNTCCRVEFMQGCSGGPRGQSYGDTLLSNSLTISSPTYQQNTQTHNSMTDEYKQSGLYSTMDTYAPVFNVKYFMNITLDFSALYSPTAICSLYSSNRMFLGVSARYNGLQFRQT